MTNQEFQKYWDQIAEIAVKYDLDESKDKMHGIFDKIKNDFIDQRNDNRTIIGKIDTKIGEITTDGKKLNNKKLSDQAKNLAQVMVEFNKTLDNTQKNLKLIEKELSNLIKSDEPIKKKMEKLKILFEKLSFQKVKLDSIQKITTELYSELDEMSQTLFGDSHNVGYAKELKKFLDKFNFMTQEYNIAKLKHAQKKFELSKELGDFTYGKRNPKLAHLLSLDSSVPVNKETPLKLPTPFGSVWVKSGEKDASRIIYINEACRPEQALAYDAMCEELDVGSDDKYGLIALFDEYSMEDMINTINVIIKYINQPLNDEYKSSLSTGQQVEIKSFEISGKLSKHLSEKQLHAAASLCGILLLSESHEFRNPNRMQI